MFCSCPFVLKDSVFFLVCFFVFFFVFDINGNILMLERIAPVWFLLIGPNVKLSGCLLIHSQAFIEFLLYVRHCDTALKMHR